MSPGWYSPGVSEMDAETPRRRPGEPHPYMLQRNPPNLWILVVMTVFSLVMAVAVLAITIVL